MADLNSFSACGRLVADSEVITSKTNGKKSLKFRIAINGINKDDTLFMSCMKYNGDALAQYLTKGKQVAINGKLKSSKYLKGSVEIESITCWVNDLTLISEKRELPDVNDAPSMASTKPAPNSYEFDDSDIPF